MEAIKYSIAYKPRNSTKDKDIKKESRCFLSKRKFLGIYSSDLKTIIFSLKKTA